MHVEGREPNFQLTLFELVGRARARARGGGGGGGGFSLPINPPRQKSVPPVSIQNRGDHTKIVFDAAMWLFVC